MRTPSIQQALQTALRHHEAGKLHEAEAIYRQILAAEPNHADALHLMGALAYQVGRHDVALDLIQRAIAQNANTSNYHNTLSLVYKARGQLPEAIRSCQRAISLEPGFAKAHDNLGTMLRDAGRSLEAVAEHQKAIDLQQHYPQAYNNLGNALGDLDRRPEAIAAYRKAIEQQPELPQPWANLGSSLRLTGQFEEAIAAQRHAIALKSDFAVAYSGLGAALQDSGQMDAAVEAFAQAARLDPRDPMVHSNLGNSLRMQGRLEESIAACRRSIEVDARYANGWSNLSAALYLQGEYEQSLAACQRAIDLAADHVEGHWNKALNLLLRGDLAEGFEQYEWRWRWKSYSATTPPLPGPRWDGSDPRGRTILLWAEQGLGDSIQFVRYAPLLAARGARVLLRCDPQLTGLLQSVQGVERVLAHEDALPQYDFQVPLMSLPKALGTTLASIPADVPYLSAEPERVQHWRDRLAQDGDTLKVGLAWAGRPTHHNDRQRSIPLSLLAPLAEVKGVRFYSLQKGDAATQAINPPPGMNMVDCADDLIDFSDTAALVQNLDLVIAVDTAIVHLAGALARPVWVLLPSVPDWRWLLGREDSPWYPTMRLFRQSARGDWPAVVRKVAENLVAQRPTSL